MIAGWRYKYIHPHAIVFVSLITLLFFSTGKSSFVHVINVSYILTESLYTDRLVRMGVCAPSMAVVHWLLLYVSLFDIFPQTGAFKENMMATVGFNMHKVQKGKVVIKVWDMGGQEKYRGMWERYCRGVEVIVFVVDANDPKLFPLAQKEMQSLLAQPTLAGVPLLVLLNKNDLPTAADPQEVVKVRLIRMQKQMHGHQHI
jgi:small GTP-binding protein